MCNKNSIVKFIEEVPNSFRMNAYGSNRYIGFVDVKVLIHDEVQRVTLAYYRSSGTNDNKRKGQWYPILGIKPNDGDFTEFSEFVNMFHNRYGGMKSSGWLMKVLFFRKPNGMSMIPDDQMPNKELIGYSFSSHGAFLKSIGESIEDQFERGYGKLCCKMNRDAINSILYDNFMYPGNTMDQYDCIHIIINDIIQQLMNP